MPLLFACALAVAVDGDTLRCRDEGLVRLARIDAPERGQPGAAEATAALAAMIGTPVRQAQGERFVVLCRQVDALSDTREGEPRRDRWGRIVARCRVGVRGQDLGGRLLRLGVAERWG